MADALIGVDVGGTFTDLILLDEQRRVRIAKVPTTLENQAFGVLAAVTEVQAELARVGTIVHGTTTTTNALLERKLARTGMITTAGFRDVIELGRRTRPTPYGLTGWFEPLVSRELRLEVDERMDARGQVVKPLDKQGVADAVRFLLEQDCETLVIHFLHSYKNPEHELQALRIAQALWPTHYITAGHKILSEYREYERGVTATVNAAVQPVLHRYVTRLADELARAGYRNELLVMRGNGGTISAGLVSESAVNTVMSGPASGVMAAAYVCREAGFSHAITYDMGGTSCDVGLILEGVPAVSSELELEYAMPIHVPMVDVHTIGAGGGSIAFINEAGLLQVGPQSAGATPGPICYGRGGTVPTITDANLVLGRLNPGGLLAVDLDQQIAPDQVKDAIARQVGRPLGLDAVEAAAAIIRIANDRMAGALRLVSLSRGYDPRDFTLFAFGGAGPLHAAALASELGVPQVLVPARPGITNAFGCLVADLRHDYVNTINVPLADVDMDEVGRIFANQIAQGRRMIDRERQAVEEIIVLHTADLQFQGQSHLLTIDVADAGISRDAMQGAFDAMYWRRFAVQLPEILAVLVNLRTAVIGRRKVIDPSLLLPAAEQSASLADAQLGVRAVWFDRWHETPIYQRERLPMGIQLQGPAIIEQLDTTVAIPPQVSGSVDRTGNLLLRV